MKIFMTGAVLTLFFSLLYKTVNKEHPLANKVRFVLDSLLFLSVLTFFVGLLILIWE